MLLSQLEDYKFVTVTRTCYIGYFSSVRVHVHGMKINLFKHTVELRYSARDCG